MSYLISPYAAIDEGDNTLIIAAAHVLGATLLTHGLRVSTVESWQLGVVRYGLGDIQQCREDSARRRASRAYCSAWRC